MSAFKEEQDLYVLKTIFRVQVDDTLTLLLVEYTDGRLGILRNGQPVRPQPWRSEELPACIEGFQALCRENTPS